MPNWPYVEKTFEKRDFQASTVPDRYILTPAAVCPVTHDQLYVIVDRETDERLSGTGTLDTLGRTYSLLNAQHRRSIAA